MSERVNFAKHGSLLFSRLFVGEVTRFDTVSQRHDSIQSFCWVVAFFAYSKLTKFSSFSFVTFGFRPAIFSQQNTAMTAMTLVLRDSNNVVNVQQTRKPNKVLLRSLSAPLPQSPPMAFFGKPKENSFHDLVAPVESSKEDMTEPSIFRTDSSSMDAEQEEMWTLKRANPIYDSDDEESMESPSKRLRNTYFDVIPEARDDEEDFEDDRQITPLFMHAQISEDEHGAITLVL